MDPVYGHAHPGQMETGYKKGRDLQYPYVKDFKSLGKANNVQVFDDSTVLHSTKHNFRDNEANEIENGHAPNFPRKGTFEPKTYQELLLRSKELFEKRHHILAKLSCNGVYDEIQEDDEDLLALIQDTLNQPDVFYKETAKAVVQSCKDTYTIQNLIKDKVRPVYLLN